MIMSYEWQNYAKYSKTPSTSTDILRFANLFSLYTHISELNTKSANIMLDISQEISISGEK